MIRQEIMRDNVLAASGQKKVDLVLKNARIVNVFMESVQDGNIAINNGYIVGTGDYQGKQETDLKGQYVCPGFIDGHIHLESSMVSPDRFQEAVIPHGTTAVIADPHEIANVAGISGIRYMLLAAENLNLDVFFMLPSCVPATDLDESGARLGVRELEPLMGQKRILGLAEVMDAAGVVSGKKDYMEKIFAALSRKLKVDGHAPLLSGKVLNAYITAGVMSDHECTNAREAMEKLERGQWIMIREGTAARNLEKLMPLFEMPFYQRCMLVTDDKHPGDLLRKGHIDYIIREAVKKGADPVRAIKMGTLNPATYFGLARRGAVAPGYLADLTVFDDLHHFNVSRVYKEGKLVALDGKSGVPRTCCAIMDSEIQERVFHSFHMEPVLSDALNLQKKGGRQRVIDLVNGELITRERIEIWQDCPGYAPGVDPDRDIIKLAAFERHNNSGHTGIGFLGNYGLKKGAVATSVGHDSHNLVIAGTNDADMAAAGNEVRRCGGGLAVALDGKILASLPLPIAGLMTDCSVEEVDEKLEAMKKICRELGVHEEIDPFVTLAFVSLPVIPALRLNTYGIIDVAQHKVVDASF